MNLNKQFNFINKTPLNMMAMRNIVRNLQWQENDKGLYETSKPLTSMQKERIADLIGPLYRAGRLTAQAAVKTKQVELHGYEHQVHHLIFSTEDLVAFGDVVDFEKIQRQKTDSEKEVILHIGQTPALNHVA